MYSRRAFLGGICAVSALVTRGGATVAAPNQFAINVDADGNALRGWDTVAYFTQGQAEKGDASFAFMWKGARWLFASARHRDLFAAAPEKYAPRIGGFCAVGAINGRMMEVDPQMWLIIEGRLYLYLNAAVREIALKGLEASAMSAEAGWDKIKPGQ